MAEQRLIDANAFKEYIRNAYEETKNLYTDNGEWAKEITESFCQDIDEQPTIEPEPLTDKEQRIFLAAMGRETKVCEEVDRNYVREPYEDSLVSVCKAIERKVKNALWAERRA